MARRNITLLNMLLLLLLLLLLFLLLLLLLLLKTEKLILSVQARDFHNVTFKLKHKAKVIDDMYTTQTCCCCSFSKRRICTFSSSSSWYTPANRSRKELGSLRRGS